MFRAAPRLIACPSVSRALPRSTHIPTRRFISTAPPHQKSRSWKSLFGRVGIAGATVYFYNTTEIFADEPRHAVHQVQPATGDDLQTELPTIEALAKERAQRKAELVAEKERAQANEAANTQGIVAGGEGGVQGLEEEAGQQGAFNPETGEINWECPCLGGMATGPCGEQFKAAFSCFVFSNEEPKGMDCVDRFKDMQNCFREYPEVYGNELESEDDDEVGDDELAALAESESAPSDTAEASKPASERRPQEDRTQAEVRQKKKEQALGGSDEVIPREAHDERAANAGKKAIKEKEQK